VPGWQSRVPGQQLLCLCSTLPGHAAASATDRCDPSRATTPLQPGQTQGVQTHQSNQQPPALQRPAQPRTAPQPWLPVEERSPVCPALWQRISA